MLLRDYKKVPVQELVNYEANSRTHSVEQIEQLVDSINEFGFTNPLLIDENNVIIAGHGRLEAAVRSNMEHVPCIIMTGLTDAQKAAYVIADNKLALNAGWNTAKLSLQFEYLQSQDYDLRFTGFGIDELALFLPEDAPEVFCGDDDLPAENDEIITVHGDLWLLGDHRLLCGSSVIQDDVDKLLGGQAPNTMITDPPYGVKYEAD